MDDNNKPGVVKVSNIQRKDDGSFEMKAADGRDITLPNTYAPQLAGATDGYVIIESNGTKRWQSTVDYEDSQKQTAAQNQQNQQQVQRSAEANRDSNRPDANQDVHLDKDAVSKPESQRKAR